MFSLGVYISRNGVVLINGSYILISDIGVSCANHLVCTSDKIPCCQDVPRFGQWYFPDGRSVSFITEAPTTFHRNRDNDGNVNMFRVHRDVMSPIGRFCCEIEDATSTNQTLCVNVGRMSLLC